jgi:hypothetical protein
VRVVLSGVLEPKVFAYDGDPDLLGSVTGGALDRGEIQHAIGIIVGLGL